MRRYRTAPLKAGRVKADDDEGFFYEWSMQKPTIDVYVSEDHWQFTGLLDAEGQPLQAYVGPDPIGFVWFEDE